MLKIQPLASGSQGNVTYIASGTTQLLVDVGLTLPQLMVRLETAKIDPFAIDGILITHEHNDHIRGVARFAKKFGTKVYIQEKAKDCFLSAAKLTDYPNVIIFGKGYNSWENDPPPLKIGDIQIDFFPLPHDSKFCFGYTFQNADCKIGLATDLGAAPNHILQKLAGSQIVLIEANHDLVRLQHNVRYSAWLKQRIASGTGHLSNIATGVAAYHLAQHGTAQIILAHLSKENNSPALAYNVVKNFLEERGLKEGIDISIDVATQDEIGQVYQVSGSGSIP